MGPDDEKVGAGRHIHIYLHVESLSEVMFVYCVKLFTVLIAMLKVSQLFIFVPIEKYNDG